MMFLIALAALPVVVRGWTFTIESFPTQCTPLSITWEGGEIPHTFSFVGLSGIQTNFSSWGTGNVVQYDGDAGGGGEQSVGAVQTTAWGFPFAAGTPLVIVGSDNTGFATGGTSDVYMVQPSPDGNASCVEPYNNTDFSSRVALWGTRLPYQCGPMLDLLNYITPPVQTAIVIPGGESFLAEETVYSNFSDGGLAMVAQTWNMTVPEGTNVAFWVQDANGVLFVSGLQTVQPQPSNDTCLPDQTVYSSTAAPAAGALSTSPPTSSGGGSTNSAGAIAGGVVGGIAGLVIIVALAMFLMRRYNRRRRLSGQQNIRLFAYAPSEPPRLQAGTTWSADKVDRLDERES